MSVKPSHFLKLYANFWLRVFATMKRSTAAIIGDEYRYMYLQTIQLMILPLGSSYNVVALVNGPWIAMVGWVTTCPMEVSLLWAKGSFLKQLMEGSGPSAWESEGKATILSRWVDP